MRRAGCQGQEGLGVDRVLVPVWVAVSGCQAWHPWRAWGCICTITPRVDGKELPPKAWREPTPEYQDFQPMSSNPKSPWPACGPRNGLVGPLQGCGKPPGKVCPPGDPPRAGHGQVHPGRGWGALLPGALRFLEPSLECRKRAAERTAHSDPVNPHSPTVSQCGGKRCPLKTAWPSRCPPHTSQVGRRGG